MTNIRDSSEGPSYRSLFAELESTYLGKAADRSVSWCLIISSFVLFIRPQSFFPFLGTIRLPMILALLTFALTAHRLFQRWTIQQKAMCALLVIQGIYGIVGKGIDPIIRNDFWHYYTWEYLLIQFGCYIFPLIALMAHGSQLKRLFNMFLWVGAYLGIYAITHNGTGPGAFLGDENDLCMVLVMILPFGILLFPGMPGAQKKLILGCVLGLILTGIVMTDSRGGFVGLVCVFGYLFWKSHKKGAFFLMAIVIGISALSFVPQEYWEEMSTIKNVDEGTAQKRRNLWSVAFKVWADPRHMLLGVGFRNVTHWLGDYEPLENKLPTGKSISGRAVHSIYFEVLADLGLVGIFLIGTIIISSYRQNRYCITKAKIYHRTIEELTFALQGEKTSVPIKAQKSEDDYSPKEVISLLSKVQEELDYTIASRSALNAAWVGFLSAGAFISVAYHPPIWFVTGMSAAGYLYWKKVELTLESILKKLTEEAIPQPQSY